jgi:predicted metal-dependent peptidase
MASAPTHSRISKAKARLLLAHPFFATLLIRTQVHVTKDVQLAATDGDKIYFNPDFLETCSVEDTMCVLAHEVGHDSLLHSIRLGTRNHDVWNQACDHAINLMLDNQGFKCPSSVPGGWLCDPKYKGWSADRIYDDLRRNPPPPPQGGGGSGKHGSGQPGKGQGQNPPGKGQGPGRDWLHGDVLPNKASDPAEQAQAEQRAKQRVAAAANMARMAGKLHGDLARMVDDMLESKVQWTDVLRDFMLKVVKSRESWMRRNRRFAKVYLPTRHEKRMGPIVFIPDTSGSMWGDDMEKICSEMAHCASQTNPENIRVVWADTKVQGEQVFEVSEFEFAKLKPQGGGGTDMTVPMKYVEQYDPQVVVLLTDGYTPWGSEPPYPLIVICTTDVACPVGQVIRI